jgi:hypothetical protein
MIGILLGARLLTELIRLRSLLGILIPGQSTNVVGSLWRTTSRPTLPVALQSHARQYVA